MSTKRKVVVAAVIVPAVLVVSVAVAVAVRQGSDPDQTPRSDPDTPVLADLSDEEAAEAKEQMDAAGQEGLDQIRDYMDQGAIPVVYHGERAGYISPDTYGLDEPETADDLGPVLDAAGNQVGYWGSGIGFLPEHVVESPGFDIETAKAGGYSEEPLTPKG